MSLICESSEMSLGTLDDPDSIPYAIAVGELPPLSAVAPIAKSPSSVPVRFGIRSLLLITTGFGILFGLLRLLGVDAASFFSSFLIFGGVALFGILCVEGSGALRRSANRNYRRPTIERRQLFSNRERGGEGI